MRIRHLALAVAAGAILVAGCGDDDSGSSDGTAAPTGSTVIAPPDNIAEKGELLFCSDISYPPMEMYEGETPVGADIDIAKEIGVRLGVSVDFANTGFDGIIPALVGEKCDAIISSMNNTEERREQVDFVDYLAVGQSFMVAKGNPAGIESIDDIAGKVVSVQVGTTNADYLAEKSAEFEAAGQEPIDIQIFPQDPDAATALRTGKTDAYFGDAPVVAYYVQQNPDVFEFGGDTINPIPTGIAIRKGDPLGAAIQAVIDSMYADGTMATILEKWSMSTSALK